MVEASSSPVHAPELGRAPFELGPGQQADQLHCHHIGPVCARGPAHGLARRLDPRAGEIGDVHRDLGAACRRQEETQRADAGESAVAFAHRPRRRARGVHVGGVEQAVDRDQRRADSHRGRTELGVRFGRAEIRRPPEERVPTRDGQRPVLRVGAVVEEDRHRERGRPSRARTPAPTLVATAGSPESATNGTTSSAPSRGWTPSWSTSDTRAATARAKLAIESDTAPASGAASVKTERL